MVADPIFLDGLFIFGDGDRILSGHSVAAGQEIFTSGQGEEPNATTVIGDVRALTGFALGGDDRIGAADIFVEAVGDAVLLTGHSRGGDDQVSAGGGMVWAYGDAETMSGAAAGGNDIVSGSGISGGSIINVYGDAGVITGGDGGDDTLSANTSVSGESYLYGDAERLDGASAGGDDILIAPGGRAFLWGDAAAVGAAATTGADRFVFAFFDVNLRDEIMDFEPGKDVIEFDGYPVSTFEALSSLFEDTPEGVLIHFHDEPERLFTGDILLRGVSVSQLTEQDFLFA